MDIVKCCWNIQRCEAFFQDFLKENGTLVKTIIKKYPIEIFLKNGEHIYVMTFKTYDMWCLGRTYRHYGGKDIYHSGYLIEGE